MITYVLLCKQCLSHVSVYKYNTVKFIVISSWKRPVTNKIDVFVVVINYIIKNPKFRWKFYQCNADEQKTRL